MDAFAQTLHQMGAWALKNLPVVNSTGLEGGWDIDFP
jgi:hypothetical protein